MTMFVSELVRLTGQEDWTAWGDEWWDHVRFIGELPGPPSGWNLLAIFEERGQSGTRLDWGAQMFQLSKAELAMIFGARAQTSPRMMGGGVRKPVPVEALDADAEYGVVVVETS
ncbi:MAG: hypothetical protein M3406_06990 [Chloroflexota bacterium]|nr:hypothetical protein [Chloroflexota bacterium]